MSYGIRNLRANFSRFYKRFSNYILIVISVSFLAIPENISNHIKATIASPLAPVQKLISKPINYFRSGFRKISLMTESADKREKLEEEVLLLQSKITEYQNTINMLYKKLETVSEFRKDIDKNEKLLVADIVGYDTSNFRKSILINVGKKQGVSVDDTVVFGSALVGRVSAAGNLSSRVLLITDPASNVPARFLKSRIQGIVKGTGNDEMCAVEYVSRHTGIKEGSRIISSGIEDIFPKSVYIGDVVEVKDSGARLFKDIKLKPRIDFSKIEHVSVIKRSKVQSINN
jgi:rod shape-determining protein MreC